GSSSPGAQGRNSYSGGLRTRWRGPGQASALEHGGEHQFQHIGVARQLRLNAVRGRLNVLTELELEQTLLPEFEARQTMKVSHRLVAANHILELSSQELQQAIASELQD